MFLFAVLQLSSPAPAVLVRSTRGKLHGSVGAVGSRAPVHDHRRRSGHCAPVALSLSFGVTEPLSRSEARVDFSSIQTAFVFARQSRYSYHNKRLVAISSKPTPNPSFIQRPGYVSNNCGRVYYCVSAVKLLHLLGARATYCPTSPTSLVCIVCPLLRESYNELVKHFMM